MKHIVSTLLLLLASTHALQADSCSLNPSTACSVATLFSPRSASVDLARQMVGVSNSMSNLACNKEDHWSSIFSITTEFSKSFRNINVARCLFGSSLLNNGCCQAINISGSSVANRGSTDWLADYFGLPTDFQSTINIDPTVISFVGDLQAYVRLDHWLCGLYFYIHAPITGTKWNLHVCEDVGKAGGQDYPQGYFGPGSIAQSNLLHSFSEYISGQTPTLQGTNPLGTSFTETFNALEYARWAIGPCESLTKTGLADLRMWIGYDWLHCECYGFGIGAILAAPTGNKPHARYLFEPIVGNGHHWELGGLIKGNYLLWQQCQGDHSLNLFTQLNITHLFSDKQKRTFDLQGKPMSRYMLAEKLTNNNTSPYLYGNPVAGQTAGSTLSNYVASGTFTPVANLTTLEVKVSASAQIDWLTMLTYTRRNLTVDLGYELWYRSCEQITPACNVANAIAQNSWALKGDAYLFGFAPIGNPDLPISTSQPVALGATESGATIYQGTNQGQTNAGLNPKIDNPQYAVAGNAASTEFVLLDGNTTVDTQTNTSIQSIFLSGNNIDICGAQTRGLSNKVFTHLSYSWSQSCHQPFIGAGIMGEFAANNSCNNSCSTCGLSQWGLWLKGGFIF